MLTLIITSEIPAIIMIIIKIVIVIVRKMVWKI